MRLSKQIIEEVVTHLAGSDAYFVVENIQKKRNVSEFKIAKDLGWDINKTRNVLYKLYNSNLITFSKKKDKSRGWYIYSWTFNPSNIRFLVKKIRMQKLNNLKSWLSREKETDFYRCSNGCVRFEFESAVDLGYKCPECGALLHHEDNTSKIVELKEKINRIESSLS